jgi:SAM-dependent methyltransferase
VSPEAFLSDYHGRHAGCSSRAFGSPGHDETGYDRLARAVAGASSILDLACGDGFLLAHLDAPDLQGCDMSPGELAAARLRLGPDAALVEARAQAMPFPDARFDAVTCHMALMLMDPVEPVLAEIQRVLKPGGRFAAVVSGPVAAGTAFKRFGELLWGIPGQRERFPPLGDPRVTASHESLAGLLAGFKDVTIEDFTSSARRPPAQAWDVLAEMYPIDVLTPAEAAELQRAYREAVAPMVGADGLLELGWGMRLVVARA